MADADHIWRHRLGQPTIACSAIDFRGCGNTIRVVGRLMQDGVIDIAIELLTPSGERVETDQRLAALLEYGNGAVGVLEASRVAGGHLVTSRIEVDGSHGSLRFSMQRLNELQVSGRDQSFKTISVLRDGDPYQSNWFPAGHPLGWVDTFSHEAMHILGAIGGRHEIGPIGATFYDGYRCAEIADSLVRASKERRALDIAYRGVA